MHIFWYPQNCFVRRANKRLTRDAGFSLLEVIVTIALIGGVLVAFQASINSLFLNRRANNQELALRVASSEMERIRSLSYDTVPTSSSFSSPLLASLPQGAGALEVNTIDDDTKQVVVRVTWVEPDVGAQRAVSLTTLVTKGGL